MSKYNWSFVKLGGATRVHIHNGEDIRHLAELDQKMWTVLSCPVAGLEIDEESLKVMDTEGDGQLRVSEVIKTSEWLCTTLKAPQVLFNGKDTLSLEDIADEDILKVAREVSADKQNISLSEVNAAIAAVTIDETPMPEAPFEKDVTEAYKAKYEEYTAYYEAEKLQKLGLATIAPETAKPGMKQKDYEAMGAQIAQYEAEAAAVQKANADALAAAQAVYAPLRKLLLLSRDFCLLLRNYVTLEDFYAKDKETKAIFQAGTLIIDQRACSLVMRIHDSTKQDAQAPASGMFLLFCDCTNKKSGQTMKIAAAMTMGEIRNLAVGKNAVFYDRSGQDWDAVVTKVIDNPISIRQAFWSPYRKFANWITDMINKSAAEKDAKAFEDMTAKTQDTIANPDAAKENKPKFNIAEFAGIFAAIGMAVGFLGDFVINLASGINSTPWWKILIWIGAILLIISGPSMIMAWLKLRRRNLAPLLNANGWAVNADAIVNVPFGATLTEQAQFPLLKLKDPFEDKGMKSSTKWLIAIACIIAAAIAIYLMMQAGIITCQCCCTTVCQ